MALFKNSKKTITTTSQIASFDVNYLPQAYADVVLTRLIKSTLASLNYQELFEQLYRFGLVEFLKNMLQGSLFKCYIYVNGKGLAVAIHSQQQTYPTLKEIEIDLTKNKATDLYNQILMVGNSLSNLVIGSYNNINLSKSIVFKMDGARARVSQDQTDSTADYVAQKINESNVFTIDSKDSFENGIPNVASDSQKNQMMLLFASLSTITGFPMSFFSGDFGGGIASTDNIEITRLFEAKELFYMEYLADFFNFISLDIKLKKTLSDMYTLAEIQSFMAVFEDRININETIKNLGFTLKK